MMTDDDGDAIVRLVARLPVYAPDAARADRVRARCRAAMRANARPDRSRRDARSAGSGPGARPHVLEPLLIGGFSLIYFFAVVHDVLRWHGVL